jgi:hypothetical protein
MALDREWYLTPPHDARGRGARAGRRRDAAGLGGIQRVHAVIGGFYLVRPRTEEEARRTVGALAAIDPPDIIPMH